MNNREYRKIKYRPSFLLSCLLSFSLFMSACGTSGTASPSGSNTAAGSSSASGTSSTSQTAVSTVSPAASVSDSSLTAEDIISGNFSTDGSTNTGARCNVIRALVPSASGILIKENESATLDYSNSTEGYVAVRYNGNSSKVKLRITGPDSIVYTYDLRSDDYEFFPLTGGNGSYTVGVYENIQDTEYSTAFFETIDVSITNELAPFLYPNQYVDFTPESECVVKSAELVASADTDLDAVSLIYNYIISNITYDYDKAETVQSGYLPNVDEILESGTGICFDYAAVMVTMLRSQGIPARLEIGYASDAYHAWLSVYIKDIGWVNGVVEFTGDTWTLMDPTFGASTEEKVLKKYIGDGTNYTLQKIY